jgi:tetratricopeptide (TPR) repeat protein
LYKDVLSVYEIEFGESHAETADVLQDYASMYSSNGEYTKAVRLSERAVRVREAKLGKSSSETLYSMGFLAGAYQSKGDYAKAEAIIRRTISICETELGKLNPQTTTALSNLAHLYADLDLDRDAIRVLIQVLKNYELQPPKYASDYTFVYSTLALSYRKIKDYVAAEKFLEKALESNKSATGFSYQASNDIFLHHCSRIHIYI